MQRSNKPRWRKVGGGVMTLTTGRDVHSGEVFRASEQEIPVGAVDLVERLDPKQAKEENEPLATNHLEMRHKGAGWYDVINTETGEAINTKNLRHDEAEELVQQDAEEEEDEEEDEEQDAE